MSEKTSDAAQAEPQTTDAASTEQGREATQQPPAGEGTPPASEPAGGDILDNATDDASNDTPAGDLLSDDGDAQREGVPDSYTFELPEGLDSEILDEAKLSAFMDKAKEIGLTQDQFQNVMSYYTERTQASVDEAVEAWNNRVDEWRQSARADKEVGGEQFDANVKTALQAVEKFGDAQFKALLKSPSPENPDGLAIGNHPAVLRFLNRIGKAIGDPSLITGDAAEQTATDDARLRRLYPSMFKESA